MTASGRSFVCEVVAPVRADLSAGFPDVAPFCQDRPGYVVNVALSLTVRVTIWRLRTGSHLAETLPRRLVSWVADELGLLILGANHGACPPGAEVVALAVRAERAAGVYGGTQDQWASACGGVGTVRQFREQGARVSFPELPPSLAAHTALVHPGGRRDSGAIVRAVTAAGEFAGRVAVVEAMNASAKHLASVLVRDDMVTLADVVNESCALLARLHPGIVSTAIRDLLHDAPGVRGAKPCGAGGSSATWIVVIDPEARTAFADSVRSLGLTVMDTEPSSGGARRLR